MDSPNKKEFVGRENHQQAQGDGGSSKSANQSNIPTISLPKGGGAIRGIGEKFAANPVTGTGSLSIPIATSPGRSGIGPQLNLSYDSGSGNGPFGLGWNLSLPSITRKTDKGIPRYLDSESYDEFILSGAEDLVPCLKHEVEEWVQENIPPRTVDGNDYNIQRYRPRIEGLFARIERWTNLTDNKDVFWRSISKDNITTWYGKSSESRVFDPENPSHIFSWLISESYDDRGNAIVYEYTEEDSANLDKQEYLDKSAKNELNRTPLSRSATRYIKRIKYGNKTSRLIQPDLSAQEWMFEVVFDYGEGHYSLLDPDAEGRQFVSADYADQLDANDLRKWQPRNDPFSTYRAGFEVRTYRLCRHVLMFHHFDDELHKPDYLVRSTDFNFTEGPVATFMNSIVQSSYKLEHDDVYFKKSLPPVEFKYTKADIQHELIEINENSLENIPHGMDGSQYRWADVDGEGTGGILTEQGGAWYYKRNLSPLTLDNEPQQKPSVQFAPLEAISPLPGFASITSGQHQIMDLAGDGQVDVVSYEEPLPGFYERNKEGNWERFKAFKSIPNISWQDPNLKFIDLTGDGHADILITEEQAFSWYASLAEEGFASAKKMQQVLDEEKGPRLVFADGTDSIYLSDMSGDGLTDIVRIRNGEVCYWPNLGYCRFGAKINMDNAPWFDTVKSFDQNRIRLADIDGSGVTDILYLRHDRVDIFLNESGNRWADPIALSQVPAIDSTSNVMAVDLMGNGTACLLWSSPLERNARSPMRYVDLMGGQKPHLLSHVINNLGTETHIHYAPSTKFYLKDKQEGREWITRLHFPIHVVEKVETYDYISRNRFVTRYAYHHGYFDGHEREFRGFAMVEQWDTEEFATLSSSGTFPIGDNIESSSHIPPVHTKTWFHTGVYLGRNKISRYFSTGLRANDTGEYFSGDSEARLLEDTILEDDWSIDEEREACRALKGQMLRQEVYALDGTAKQEYPYTVTEQNFTIKRLQPKHDNPHAVFFTHAREVLNYHYERNPADPRISHAITLDVDDYGNVRKSVSIAYGRRIGQSPLLDQDRAKQEQVLITYTKNELTNAIHEPDDYRSPLPRQISTYELTGLVPDNGASHFSYTELTENSYAKITGLTEVPYEQAVDYSVARKRLIELVRTVYRSNDLSHLLTNAPYVESMAFPGESYKLAFTPGLLTQVYKRDGQPLISNVGNVLGGTNSDQGGYVDLDNDGHWWIPSGRTYFSEWADLNDEALTALDELTEAEHHFFLPVKFANPFKHCSYVEYDKYDLLIQQNRDALNNTTTVGERNQAGDVVVQGNNYRVLQAQLMMGPNGNRSQVAFDTLGLVVGTAVMGKNSELLGDTLGGFEKDLTKQQIDDFHNANDPHIYATQLLQAATSRIIYDVERFYRSRKAHPQSPDNWQPTYSANLSREIHFYDLPPSGEFKTQISFSYSDSLGREIQKKIQAEQETGSNVLRWVGSGWTIYNNKSKPVRQYEPFFTKTHDFEVDREQGVSPIVFYDPIGRVVATIHPNHTYEKVVFDPWQQITYDVNDTVNFNPQADIDIRPYLLSPDNTHRLPYNDYLPTWYQLRTDPSNNVEFEMQYPDAVERDHQTEAANKAVGHANTPTITHMDALGRHFLTILHNKVVCSNHPLDATEELFETRIELDIEGNQRSVRDADIRVWDEAGNLAFDDDGNEITDPLGRIVMQYDYHMAGPVQDENGETKSTNRIHQLSMEAGARWILNDLTGNPIRSWDSRGHVFRTEYDVLRRPIKSWVKGADQVDPDLELITERLVYGEQHPQAVSQNLLGQLYLHFDQAGVASTEAIDFKGNVKQAKRRLAKEYKLLISWHTVDNVLPTIATQVINEGNLEAELVTLLEDDSYHTGTSYDALNRPLTSTAPDDSIYYPSYNEANLLDSIEVDIRGSGNKTKFVKNIDYDAKGQRKRIEYQNGITTLYKYDKNTFRLIRLQSIRGTGIRCENTLSDAERSQRQCPKSTPVCRDLQNLHYTYDPIGNITHIHDNAQQTIYFNNRCVEPSNEYRYDAIYRLIQATGREQLGQAGGLLIPIPHSHNDAERAGRVLPSDGNAMGRYCEHYVYDAVGNFEQMSHHGDCNSAAAWRRNYSYNETSLIEANKHSNRLTRAPLAGEVPNAANDFIYDQHGSMKRMSHLPLMQWDYRDQLQASSQQVIESGIPETTWYVCDAAGQRVRKITESSVTQANIANGLQSVKVKERTYLGGYEIFREYQNDGVTEKLKRDSLHVMDDKQRIALVETRTSGYEPDVPQQITRYHLNNHLGSSSLELDQNGALISYEEYTPYGSSSFQAGRNSAEVKLKRYRYSGKERDEESGLYYHGARYYAPWLAKWISVDQAVFWLFHTDEKVTKKSEILLNSYESMADNPIIFLDADGYAPKKSIIVVGKMSATFTLTLADGTEKEVEVDDIRKIDKFPEVVRKFAKQQGAKNVGSSTPIIMPTKEGEMEKVINDVGKGGDIVYIGHSWTPGEGEETTPDPLSIHIGSNQQLIIDAIKKNKAEKRTFALMCYGARMKVNEKGDFAQGPKTQEGEVIEEISRLQISVDYSEEGAKRAEASRTVTQEDLIVTGMEFVLLPEGTHSVEIGEVVIGSDVPEVPPDQIPPRREYIIP